MPNISLYALWQRIESITIRALHQAQHHPNQTHSNASNICCCCCWSNRLILKLNSVFVCRTILSTLLLCEFFVFQKRILCIVAMLLYNQYQHKDQFFNSPLFFFSCRLNEILRNNLALIFQPQKFVVTNSLLRFHMQTNPLPLLCMWKIVNHLSQH